MCARSFNRQRINVNATAQRRVQAARERTAALIDGKSTEISQRHATHSGGFTN
jgi:hypothetical protein